MLSRVAGGSVETEEAWEKQYTQVRESVLRIGSGDNVSAIDKSINALEAGLKNMREEAIQNKRTKIADLRRSLLLRQANSQNRTLSAMSSSSSGAARIGQSNEQLLEQAREEMRRQDETRLGAVSSDLQELRMVGDRITETATLQTRLIDEIVDDSRGTERLLGTMGHDGARMKKLRQASSVGKLQCAIIALTALFFVLLIMKA